MNKYYANLTKDNQTIQITEKEYNQIKPIQYGKITIKDNEYERKDVNLKIIHDKVKVSEHKDYSAPEYSDDLDEFQSIKVLALSRQLFRYPQLEYFFRHKLSDTTNFVNWLKSTGKADKLYDYLRADSELDIKSDQKMLDDHPSNNYTNNPDIQSYCLQTRLIKLKSLYEIYLKENIITDPI